MTDSPDEGSVPKKQLQHKTAVGLLTFGWELSLAGMHSMLNLMDEFLLKLSKRHHVERLSHRTIRTRIPAVSRASVLGVKASTCLLALSASHWDMHKAKR